MTGSNSSAAATLTILVSGATDAPDATSAQEEAEITFDAKEMPPGFFRFVRAGELYFTATIETAEILAIANRAYFDMGSPSVWLAVSFSPPESSDVEDSTPRVRVQVRSPMGQNCSLQPASGPCKAEFERYFYDASSGRCQFFSWGGCEGVVPFETLEDCITQCER